LLSQPFKIKNIHFAIEEYSYHSRFNSFLQVPQKTESMPKQRKIRIPSHVKNEIKRMSKQNKSDSEIAFKVMSMVSTIDKKGALIVIKQTLNK
jgi:hypothetical protein